MNRATRLPAALAVLILLSNGGAEGQEGYVITGVAFQGNATFGSGDLEDRLLFPPSGWIGRLFSGEDPSIFSDDNMTKEAESLRRFLQKEGFLDAEVTWSLSAVDDDARKVEILYSIREGSPVAVGSVRIRLGGPESTAAESIDSVMMLLDESVQMTKGDRFRDESLHADRSHLLRVLNDNGFPYSTVSDSIILNREQDSVDIGWSIVTGPLASFGPHTLEGNDLYNEDLVHDRVYFHEGVLYRQSLLEETQRDIYDLGLYRVVSIKALLSDRQDPAIPVEIRVEESPRYRFRLGVGYGRDEEFRVSARVDILGIFGTAGQVGLELKRSALEPITFLVTYLHPDFLIPKTRFTVRPFLRREDEPGYEARRSGYDVGLARPLAEDLFASLSYGYESVDIGRTPNVPLPPNYRDSYPKESVTLSLGFNSASPLFAPAGGFSVALTTSFSGLNLFWSDEYQFTRTILDLRYYLGVSEDLVIATRAKVGTMRSRDDPEFIPFEERFYAGGSVSIRGWARSTLGPLDPEGRPIGGTSLLETGVEFRFPHRSVFQGVLFMDAGNTWETPATYKLDDLGYAAGIGLRYSTPIGPLRLDVAHPLFIGSRETQWWFSIGHAF